MGVAKGVRRAAATALATPVFLNDMIESPL
jgi:hypothetical protein